MPEELKPCQCGDIPKIVVNTDWESLVTTYYPLCSCGRTTLNQYSTKQKAATAWNTRT